MKIEVLEKRIEQTAYWDMPILDVQTQYFGDEVYLFVENDEEKCWKISFISCYKVNYETDANWRNIDNVKDMRGGQLGYYGQDISIKKYKENESFIESSIDLSIMTMSIVCKDIFVEEVETKGNSFFWEYK
ncbi:hypothetical protein [Oceanobacillus sp. J11TS1]|uniref:hypothetical protein n=1 Tax=Oceanobacillus sp. J11TS1 TaxID=2807191 RepID=UPI001B2B769D|nr:hypothetical protein [Oceanobacillus sp. J11TS1]GIO22182.1 hypothetical protein J11TS1_07630 [Oceanobacillus sp. J11TS1]